MIERGIASTKTIRIARWVFFMLLVCLLPALAAKAQDEGANRKLEAAKKKVHALLREAEELQEMGKREKAQELRHKAEDLKATIEAAYARQKRGRAEGVIKFF